MDLRRCVVQLSAQNKRPDRVAQGFIQLDFLKPWRMEAAWPLGRLFCCLTVPRVRKFSLYAEWNSRFNFCSLAHSPTTHSWKNLFSSSYLFSDRPKAVSFLAEQAPFSQLLLTGQVLQSWPVWPSTGLSSASQYLPIVEGPKTEQWIQMGSHECWAEENSPSLQCHSCTPLNSSQSAACTLANSAARAHCSLMLSLCLPRPSYLFLQRCP